MGRLRKYQTEKERKEAQREACKRYRERHKEEITAKQAEYYQDNKEKIAEQMAEYQSTPKGRAVNLVGTYKQEDNKYSRGECTLTAEWVIEHIFSQPCYYCGETDWKKLGCDRLDNNLPHTPENVVPCCCECNKKKARYSYEEYLKIIGKIA